jgi:hypothetical protein
MTTDIASFPNHDVAIRSPKNKRRMRPVGRPELFREAAAQPGEQAQVDYLREMRHPVILRLLDAILNENIEWLVYPTRNFKPSDLPDAEGLEYEVIKKRLYLFTQDKRNPGFDVLGDNQPKRQKLWEDMLCSLSRDAAVMMLNASKKILPEGLSPQICFTAFPDELAGDRATHFHQQAAAQEHPRNPNATATADAARELTAAIVHRNAVHEEVDAEIARLEAQIRTLKSRKQIAADAVRLAEERVDLFQPGRLFKP